MKNTVISIVSVLLSWVLLTGGCLGANATMPPPPQQVRLHDIKELNDYLNNPEEFRQNGYDTFYVLGPGDAMIRSGYYYWPIFDNSEYSFDSATSVDGLSIQYSFKKDTDILRIRLMSRTAHHDHSFKTSIRSLPPLNENIFKKDDNGNEFLIRTEIYDFEPLEKILVFYGFVGKFIYGVSQWPSFTLDDFDDIVNNIHFVKIPLDVSDDEAAQFVADAEKQISDEKRLSSMKIADAVTVLRYIAGLETLSDERKQELSFKGDEPSISDAVVILRYLARLVH